MNGRHHGGIAKVFLNQQIVVGQTRFLAGSKFQSGIGSTAAKEHAFLKKKKQKSQKNAKHATNYTTYGSMYKSSPSKSGPQYVGLLTYAVVSERKPPLLRQHCLHALWPPNSNTPAFARRCEPPRRCSPAKPTLNKVHSKCTPYVGPKLIDVFVRHHAVPVEQVHVLKRASDFVLHATKHRLQRQLVSNGLQAYCIVYVANHDAAKVLCQVRLRNQRGQHWAVNACFKIQTSCTPATSRTAVRFTGYPPLAICVFGVDFEKLHEKCWRKLLPTITGAPHP